MTMEIDFKLLTAHFEPDQIQWRAGATNNKENPTQALALAYIDARSVQERLDLVCGPENWRDEYRAIEDGFICALSIRCGDEWITKEDGADKSDTEPLKGGISDALKRAAVKWGIGRYLYDLPVTWVACQKRGRSVVLSQQPQLPQWALPQDVQNTPPKPEPQAQQQEAPSPQNGNGKATAVDIDPARELTGDQRTRFVKAVQDAYDDLGDVVVNQVLQKHGVNAASMVVYAKKATEISEMLSALRAEQMASAPLN